MTMTDTMTAGKSAADDATLLRLREQLFADPDLGVYAILDGASIPDLIKRLILDVPEYVCLYAGPIAPVLAEVAPYLVKLRPESPFTEWVLRNGWLRHWGIFALSRGTLPQLRNHFRRFLMVHDPDGKRLYFRFYDPRVLGVYLPTCNEEERNIIFGPVEMYMYEDREREELMAMTASQ